MLSFAPLVEEGGCVGANGRQTCPHYTKYCYRIGGAPSGCRASHGKLLRTRKEALRGLNTCATLL